LFYTALIVFISFFCYHISFLFTNICFHQIKQIHVQAFVNLVTQKQNDTEDFFIPETLLLDKYRLKQMNKDFWKFVQDAIILGVVYTKIRNASVRTEIQQMALVDWLDVNAVSDVIISCMGVAEGSRFSEHMQDNMSVGETSLFTMMCNIIRRAWELMLLEKPLDNLFSEDSLAVRPLSALLPRIRSCGVVLRRIMACNWDVFQDHYVQMISDFSP